VRARAKALTPPPDIEAASLRLSQAIGDTSSQRNVALRLGVSRSLVAQWCTPASPKLPSGRLRVLLAERCPSVARALGRLEVAALLDAPRPARLDLLHHLALVTTGIGDVAREVSEALHDGVVDDTERRRIRRELLDALARGDAMLRDLEDAR